MVEILEVITHGDSHNKTNTNKGPQALTMKMPSYYEYNIQKTKCILFKISTDKLPKHQKNVKEIKVR